MPDPDVNVDGEHWRPGRHQPRNLYRHRADDPDGDGEYMGVMFDPATTAMICRVLNAREPS